MIKKLTTPFWSHLFLIFYLVKKVTIIKEQQPVFLSYLNNYWKHHFQGLGYCFLLCLLSFSSIANPRLDSLLQLLPQHSGEQKVNALISIAQYYRFNHPDSSANYAEQALLLAESVGYEVGRMEALNYWALAEQAEGDYSDAIKNHYEALKIAENMGDQHYAHLTKIYLGSANYMNKDLEQAQKFYHDAEAYFLEKETDEAKTHLATVFNNLGMLSKKSKHTIEAINYYKKSMKLKEELGQKRGIANTLHHIGILYQENTNYELALVYLQRALTLKKEIADKIHIAATYAQIASCYLLLKQANRAMTFAQLAVKQAESTGEKGDLKNAYLILSDIYAYQGKYEQAHRYYRQFHQMYDSLFTTENLRHIAELQAIYGIKQKHIQNLGLIREKEAQDRIIVRQRITNIVVISAFFLLLLLSWALYRNNRQKRRAYHLLEVKKEKLNDRTIALTKANHEMERLTDELSGLLEKTRFQTQILKQHQEEIRSQNEELLTQQEDLNTKNKELQTAIDHLKHAQSQLVQSEKMASLGQLTAGIAHEINNPINYINSGIIGLKSVIHDLIEVMNEYDQLTTENYLDKFPSISHLKEELEFHELISGMNTLTRNIMLGAERTTNIVKGLRRFSHRDGKEPKQTDLHENLDSTLMLLHHQYKSRVKIERNYGEIPLIECFGGKMNQVFMNILSNAIQAVSHEGQISIETKYIEDFQEIKHLFSSGVTLNEPIVRIQIQDTGRGMPQMIQNRIYDPFFTTKDVGEGTGLGLAISLNIIKEHRGIIEFESQENVGTIFNICLPITQPKNFSKEP